jgi:thiamine biosynthesis lipoprotein
MTNRAFFRFAHEAMATVFEAVIAGETEKYSRQAAQAVFQEWDRLGGMLSRFIESSDVSRINRLGAVESVRVNIETFECLQTAMEIHRETDGAFDVTLGGLTDYWKARAGTAVDELREEADSRRTGTGMDLMELDPETLCVRLKSPGPVVDLGGIGKGYALDRAAEILRDWSIESALLQGGESTVLALGAPPGREVGRSSGGGNGGERPRDSASRPCDQFLGNASQRPAHYRSPHGTARPRRDSNLGVLPLRRGGGCALDRVHGDEPRGDRALL